MDSGIVRCGKLNSQLPATFEWALRKTLMITSLLTLSSARTLYLYVKTNNRRIQCVVSEQDCMESARRQRWRSVLRHPGPDVISKSSTSSSACPALEETQRCDLDVQCAAYSLRWGDWGGCQTYQNSECGPGRRQRHYECIRQDDGLVVSRRYCAQNVSLPATCFVLHTD